MWKYQSDQKKYNLYICRVVKEDNNVKQRIVDFQKNLQSYLKVVDWFTADIRNDPNMIDLIVFDMYCI